MLDKDKGFTLIEILVVISIIGILAGLLIGAIGGARQRASRLECQSNIRQLLLACQMYEQEEGEFPPAWDVADLFNTYLAVNSEYITPDPQIMNCPTDENAYIYNSNMFFEKSRALDSLKPSAAVLLRDASDTIHKNGCNIGFADGHVSWYGQAALTGWATKGDDPYKEESEW